MKNGTLAKSGNWRERFVVKRSIGRGKGLFARVPIRKGAFVIEYTGTKIPTKLADTLPTRYLFEINSVWTIDGPVPKNTAGYINHSCDPNCESEIEKEHIMLYAIKNIAAGEELSFDYGKEYFDEFIGPRGCHCGSVKCRKPAR